MTTESIQPESRTTVKGAKQTGMPWRFVLVLVVLMAVIVVAGRLRHGNPDLDLVDWRASYDSAVVEAHEADKPLLVVFGADWCGSCEQMKALVYSDKQVADTIEAGFVPVHVDMTSDGLPDQYLADRYWVQGYPTLLVLDAGGNPISASAGAMSKAGLLTWLDHATARRLALIGTAALADDRPGD